jgi:hypothetical protein
MDNSIITQYLSIRGYTTEEIASVLSNEEKRANIVNIILAYETELKHKGFSRREAIANYRIYRKNVERDERIITQFNK